MKNKLKLEKKFIKILMFVKKMCKLVRGKGGGCIGTFLHVVLILTFSES